jgi:allantoate deiminase
VFCAPLLQDVVREGILAAAPSGDDPASIFSRAGHDAMAIAAVTDVGMLFLRNPGGISHHPDESVGLEDVTVGIQALVEAALHLAAERSVVG